MSQEDRSVLTRVAPEPDLVVRYGRAAEQVIDVWPGDPSAAERPLVALLHGGFWRPGYDRTHLRSLATAIRDAGWTVASIEYRREPGHPDLTIDDVRAALAAVTQVDGHDGSIVLVGHSAGGHLALWAASAVASPGLRAAIPLAPVADLEEAHHRELGAGAVHDFLGEPPSSRPDLDPIRLPAPRTPVVIVHGADDAVVPIELALRYQAAHPGTEVVSVPGTGHFALIDPLSHAWPTVREQLDRWR